MENNDFWKIGFDISDNKKLISPNLQNLQCGTLDFKNIIGMFHNMLFIFESQFRKKLDFKDNVSSLLMFGCSNKFENMTRMNNIDIYDISLDFYHNYRLNSFYLDKPKKIMYYIISMIINPEKKLMKNALSLIFSLSKLEVIEILPILLEKYKILFQDDYFLAEKSIQNFLNDTHIFDLSPKVFDHFSRICVKSSKKSFDNLDDTEFEKFLIEILQKQSNKLFGAKNKKLYENGGMIVTSLIIRFSNFLTEKNDFIKQIFFMIKSFVKKSDLIKICLDQKIYHIVKNEFLE